MYDIILSFHSINNLQIQDNLLSNIKVRRDEQ